MEGFLKEILSCGKIFFNNDPVIMQYLIKVHQNSCSTIFFRCRYLSSEREAMLSVHDEMSTMPEGINNNNIIIIIIIYYYYYYYYCKPCLSHSVAAFSAYILKICGNVCL